MNASRRTIMLTLFCLASAVAGCASRRGVATDRQGSNRSDTERAQLVAIKAFLARFEVGSKATVFYISLAQRTPSAEWIRQLAGEPYTARPYRGRDREGAVIEAGEPVWRSGTQVAVQVIESPRAIDRSACTVVMSRRGPDGWEVNEIVGCWIE